MGLAGTKTESAWARYLTAGAIMLAGAGAFAVTAAGNYAYGLTQGTDEPFLWVFTNRQMSAYGCLVADIAALGLATSLPSLCRAKSWPLALCAAVLCIVATVFAFSNTLGFLGMERASAEAVRKHGAGGYGALAEDLAKLRRERGWVPKHNQADVVLAHISEKEASPLYTSSRQCTWITKPESRALCDDIKALRTEAATAGTAARMDRDIQAMQAQLNGAQPVVSVDFLATYAGNTLGITEDAIGTWQPFAKALVICLLAVFCFAIADGVLASGSVQAATETLPVIHAESPPKVPAVSLHIQADPIPDKIEDACYEEEKPLQIAIGQAPDGPGRNVIALLTKPITAQDWVSRWAKQMRAGTHAFADLKGEYEAFVKYEEQVKRCPIPKIRTHQLASHLKQLGYSVTADATKKGKVYVEFPKSLARQPSVAVG